MRAFSLLLLLASPLFAQLPNPRLNSVYPCGARQGTTVEVAIAGGEIADATGLWFSHAGITAKPAGAGKFAVTVAAEVPVGTYDVRAVTPFGVSNFRAFAVGDLPEFAEKEPNDEPAQANRVTIPCVANGRIEKATDVDHFVFAGKKGQRIIVDCVAWRLDSQLDGTLLVLDPAGKEIAYSGDYYGRDPFLDFTAPADGDYTVKVWDFVYNGASDNFYRLRIGELPHLDAAVPAAVAPGTKTSVTFYGRNLPGSSPAPAGMTAQGRPLEMVVREIEAPAEGALTLATGEAIRPGQAGLDGMAYRVAGPAGTSNPLFLAFTRDPIVVEREPNDDRATAQVVEVPSDISGAFAAPGDRDTFAFKAKKGEKVVVEVFGQRQSGLVDPNFAAFDPAGKKLNPPNSGNRNIGQLRFATQSNDGRWDIAAAADGDYAIQLRDLYFQQRGEPRFTYRVSVRRPRDDFRLVVCPSHDVQPDAMNVGQGGRHWADVLAFRQDGFDGPISIRAENLPAGVACDPAVIGPGKTSAPLVFRATTEAKIGAAAIRVVGTATIEGKEAEREARGGGLAWPTVNTPGIARMADGIVIGVRPAVPFNVSAVPASEKVAAGEKLTIAVKVERTAGWDGDVQFSGYDLPTGATVALMTVGKAATEGKVEVAIPAKAKAGTYTFALHGAGQASRDYGRPADPKAKEAKAANVRAVYPTNAITVTVVEGK